LLFLLAEKGPHLLEKAALVSTAMGSGGGIR